MEVRFLDSDLDRLETDPDFTAGHARAIVASYRKVLQLIRAAPDERDFYQFKSLHYEKLKGKRQHQRSMRLTKKWRLIIELETVDGHKMVVVVAIDDYH